VAADSLLAALQGNYGSGEPVVDDVNTVRGLLNFCRKWSEGLVHPEELNNPCLAMAGRLRAGADQMEVDLRGNPDMGADMRAPITRTMEAYRAIADVLDEFPEFAKDDNVDDFLDNLEVFEEERQAVLDAQEQIQFQLSGQVLLCPRCGGSGESANCEACGLARLYPDPQAMRARHEQARLPGLYGKVFRAYQRVIAGERSLHVVIDALAPLEEHLETLVSARKQLLKRLASKKLKGQRFADARAAEMLLAGAESDVVVALKGVERMKGAEQTLRMSDLSRGWEDIFHAAQVIEVTADRIRRRLGHEEEPEAPGPGGSGADDLISFSGE
jgi:hypothetical protein